MIFTIHQNKKFRTLLWKISELEASETTSMKRYFKPIEKDGSAKRPTLSPSKESAGDETASLEPKREPLKFLTWNANSFLLRVKNDWPELTKFVSGFDPDVISIQVSQWASERFLWALMNVRVIGSLKPHGFLIFGLILLCLLVKSDTWFGIVRMYVIAKTDNIWLY